VSSYHGWTHAQKSDGGTDPIPLGPSGLGIPDLILSGGSTTIADNTTKPVPFPDVSYPNRTLIGSHYDLNTTDTGDIGNTRYEVTSLRQGWYAADLLTQWDQTATGGTNEFGYAMQRITWTVVSGFGFSPTEYRDAADWMDADVHPLFEFVNNSYLRTWISPHYVPANRVWQMTAIQRTGISRGLSGIYMKFWFLGADTLTDWTFDTV
jgi:hypothetical protein